MTVRKRGRGYHRTTAHSHRSKSEACYRAIDISEKESSLRGVITGFDDDPGKTCITMRVMFENGENYDYLAPEGLAIGDHINEGVKAALKIGNIKPLSELPEGTPIFNIEQAPGDGGRMVRASGGAGYIVSKNDGEVMVKLPSKAVRKFLSTCRATIGMLAGGGRPEKPLVKAGAGKMKANARGHYYPIVRGVAMNPVDHPHGGCQHHAGKATTVSRNAPPGAKVGHIAARQTGRRKKLKVKV